MPPGSEMPNNPSLKHFRSASLPEVVTQINSDWSECIVKDITLPAEIIHNKEDILKTQSINLELIPEEDITQNEDILTDDGSHTSLTGGSEVVIEFYSDPDPFNEGTVSHLEMASNQSQCKTPEKPPLKSQKYTHSQTEWLTSESSESESPSESPFALVNNEPSTSSSQKTKETPVKKKYIFQTKLGKALVSLFGETDDTVEIDQCRNVVKNSKDPKAIRKYKALQALMSTKVVGKYNSCTEFIRSWENDFIAEHNRFPITADIKESPDIYELYKQRHVADELLQSWDISVHT